MKASARVVLAATKALQGASPVGINAYVIRAGKKPRFGRGQPDPKWRKSQVIQAAITADYPHSLPDKLNHTKLTVAVNKRLETDPAFAKFRKKVWPVSRTAVTTALRMLRRANP